MILNNTLVKRKNNFIEKANKIHNNKYDYSKVQYKNTSTKVEIICKEHGSFFQLPSNHIGKRNKNGCPKCKINSLKNKEEYIKKANKIHNNK
jgi:uncharacterized C2H2 Zn-finger protein